MKMNANEDKITDSFGAELDDGSLHQYGSVNATNP
jgi:hypothetical protein